MTTIVTAAPGDQEVNRRRAEEAPAVGAGQHSVTSSNNYGVSGTPFTRSRVRPCTNTRRAPHDLQYGFLTICNATTLHWRFETAVPHVNTSAAAYTDDLWLVVDSHGPRANLPPA